MKSHFPGQIIPDHHKDLRDTTYKYNILLANNFRLYEFIEAHPSNSEKFKRIAWKNIEEFNFENSRKGASFLQSLRGYINRVFQDNNDGHEIAIRITSAFRPVEWEKLQGRSGDSIHTLSLAWDIQPVNCSLRLAVQIMKHLENIHWSLDEGHQGGFAVKRPTYNGSRIILAGFIHYDMGRKRRWYY